MEREPLTEIERKKLYTRLMHNIKNNVIEHWQTFELPCKAHIASTTEAGKLKALGYTRLEGTREAARHGLIKIIVNDTLGKYCLPVGVWESLDEYGQKVMLEKIRSQHSKNMKEKQLLRKAKKLEELRQKELEKKGPENKNNQTPDELLKDYF